MTMSKATAMAILIQRGQAVMAPLSDRKAKRVLVGRTSFAGTMAVSAGEKGAVILDPPEQSEMNE